MLWLVALRRRAVRASGAGAGAGPADSESLLAPPLPPITAATMKTIATTTSAAIPFSAPGIGLRRRLGFGGWRRLRRPAPAALAALGGLLGSRFAAGFSARGARLRRRRHVGVDRAVGAHGRNATWAGSLAWPTLR